MIDSPVDANLHFRIAPTDLVYLLEDCKRCFYDTYRNGFKRPTTFSPHFTNADRAMRTALGDGGLIDVGAAPPFRVHSQGLRVESAEISFEQHGVTLSFAGNYDALVETEDDEMFLVDYKTTTQDDLQLRKFRRQLASYVYALEKPKNPTTSPIAIDGMALLVFDPRKFVFKKSGKVCGLYGPTRWVELSRDDRRFNALLNLVAELLAGDAVEANAACGYCRLRGVRESRSGVDRDGSPAYSPVVPNPS